MQATLLEVSIDIFEVVLQLFPDEVSSCIPFTFFWGGGIWELGHIMVHLAQSCLHWLEVDLQVESFPVQSEIRDWDLLCEKQAAS